MSSALQLSPETQSRHARQKSWQVLSACTLTSLLVHLMLIWLWPGYGGVGIGVPRLRATFRSMPAVPLPEASAAGVFHVPVEVPPSSASANLTVRGVPAKPPANTPPVRQTTPARQAEEESGGGRLSEYWPVELLDARPQFLVDMREYIPASLDGAESGRIVVQMLIGVEGEVDGVVLERSELTPRATRRFIQRLDALKLQPGLLDGRPVKARWRMEFDFSPVTE